jgi:hypothetical protein
VVPSGGPVPSQELVGIEIEVENMQQANPGHDINRVWNIVQDGSLRNNGLEFTTKPIPASAAPVALEYLLKQYLSQECCFSPRTSVHVHLNVQNLQQAQVLDYLLLYVVFEQLFYKFVGKGRQKNIYCVPLSDSNLLANLVDYGETRRSQWSKYTGLNTLPVGEYGTIEWRHMHGTTDVAKLSVWINLITKLKEYVVRVGTKGVRSAIAEMHDGYNFSGLLQEIFGEHAEHLRYEGPKELSYLQAKQAMASYSTTRTVQGNLSPRSSFFTFKG